MSLISAEEIETGEWCIRVHGEDGKPTSFFLLHVATHFHPKTDGTPGFWRVDGATYEVRHRGITHILGDRSSVEEITPLVHAHGPIARRMQEALTRDVEAYLAKFPPPAPPPSPPRPPPTLGGPNLARLMPEHEDPDVHLVSPLYRAGWQDAIEWLRANDNGTRCESGCCGSPGDYEEAIEALTEHVDACVDGAW